MDHTEYSEIKENVTKCKINVVTATIADYLFNTWGRIWMREYS